MLILFYLLFTAKIIHENDSDELKDLFKRSKVQHPSATINREDIERAKKNIEKHQWARTAKRRILNTADNTISLFSDNAFLDKMIPQTSPASLTFCPHCASLGSDYHPNGQWSWNVNDPDHITCAKCKMVFPNSKYPEVLKYQSTWDPQQTITYVNNGPKKCMNYLRCYSSVEGVIRNHKLDYTIKRLTYLSQAYSLSDDPKYAEATKRILLKLADRFPHYMVYCGYSYNQYADCDPHYVVQNLPKLPIINGEQCKMIVADPELATDTFFSDYWSAGRFGTSGSDGEYVEILALAYDLVADATKEDGTPIFSEEEKRHIEEDLLIESCLLGYFDKKINNKSTLNMKGCTIVGLVVGNAKLVRFGLDGYNKVFDEFFLKDGSTSQSVTYGLKTLLGFDGFHLAFRNYSDPPYYVPQPGEVQYKNFNINKDTDYESLWHSLIWCMYYNTSYPIIGDQSHGQTFPKEYYEFLANEFKHDYIQEFVGSIQNKQTNPNNNALFLRDIDYVPFDGNWTLPDMVYPYLQQGFIRTGENGENSLLVLDASPGDGGHHHYDSLNIIYTKFGNELLNDLGYLNDHPNKSKTMATVAHNTVLIDGADQKDRERGGEFHIFETMLKDTKVMQASSKPYESTSVYHRTLVQIEHDKDENYIVDIFRSNGGTKRRELVFHGPNNNYSMNNKLIFDIPYEIIPVFGYIQFAIRAKESFEIADISMYETNEDGSKGKELIPSIPDEIETNITKFNCTKESFFCGKYNRNNPFEYSVTNGPEKGSKAFKVHCNITQCSGNLYIAHEQNLLQLKENSRYILQFKLKGETFVKNVRLQLPDKNATTVNLVKQSLWNIYPDKWTLFTGYFDIGAPFSEALGTTTSEPVSVHWEIDNQMNFSAFIPARKDQKVYFKNGWGQRYLDNRDFGVTLPYFFFNRDVNEQLSTWVTVYEGYNKSNRIVNRVEAQYESNGNVVVKIDTKDGIDFVSSSFDGDSIADGFGLKSDGKVAVINNEKVRLYDGTKLEFNGKKITRNLNQFSGTINSYGNSEDRENSWFDIDGNIDEELVKPGQVLFVKDEEGVNRGYPIQKVSKVNKAGLRVFVKSNYRGFKSHKSKEWHLVDVATEFDEDQKDEITSASSNDDEVGKTSSSIDEEVGVVSGSNDDNNDPNQSTGGKGMSKGVIAAIVIVVIIVVAAVVVGLVIYFKRRQHGRESSDYQI